MNIGEVAIVCLTITLFGGVGFGVAAFRSFDRLLRIQYLKHRGQWELDGGPIGFWWVPPDAKMFSGTMARSQLASTWTSTKPSWVEGDDEAAKAYAEFKRLSKFANRVTLAYVGGFALICVAFFVFLRR